MEATLRPPLAPDAADAALFPAAPPGDAADGPQQAQGDAAVDPSTLALQLQFTPWTGQEVAAEPALLAPVGQLSASRPP